MARFCPLASGSGGNSTYIQSGKSAVLIDAGISYKTLCERISAAGGSIGDLSAVAVTHSHSDHIGGLKTLIKNTGLPVYATRGTAETLIRENLVPGNAEFVFCDEESAVFGDIEIARFATSHDTNGSCGYRVNTPSGSCGVCTDLGVVTDEVRRGVAGCRVLLFEFNHDIDMLRRGPYPPHLKIRILSDLGHLSNASAAAEVPFILGSGTNQLILGHISRHNNTPDIALSAAKTAAALAGAKAGEDFLLSAAKPGMSGVSVF